MIVMYLYLLCICYVDVGNLISHIYHVARTLFIGHIATAQAQAHLFSNDWVQAQFQIEDHAQVQSLLQYNVVGT